MRYEDAMKALCAARSEDWDKAVMVKTKTISVDIYEQRPRSMVQHAKDHSAYVYTLYCRRSEDGQWMMYDEYDEDYAPCDDPRPEEDREVLVEEGLDDLFGDEPDEQGKDSDV